MSAAIDKLSDQERKVLDLLAQGFTQQEVAKQFGLSPNTITTHVSRAKKKLGARNPMHAILIYHRYAISQEPTA